MIIMDQEIEQTDPQLTETELQHVIGGVSGKLFTRGLGVVVSIGSFGYAAAKAGVKKATVTVTKGEHKAPSDNDIKKIVDDAIGPH